MQNFKIFLFFLSLIILFTNFTEAQTPQKKKSGSKKTEKIKPIDESGCFLVSMSRRGNGKYNVHYSCPPRINEISLSQSKIAVNCEITESSDKKCFSNSSPVEIEVSAADAENDFLIYNYKVSGGKIVSDNYYQSDGKIIGYGYYVFWDLSGVKPGAYKITVCADDGLGCEIKDGKNVMTKEIQIVECLDCEK